jgi:hypothetical protein
MKYVIIEHGKDYPHETAVKHEFKYFFEVLDLLKASKLDIDKGNKVFEISAEEGDVEA